MTEIAPRITADEGTRFGQPVIMGTRVAVHVLPGKLAAGMTVEQVAAEYDVGPRRRPARSGRRTGAGAATRVRVPA